MSTKKASRKNAAVQAKKSAVEETRITTGVQAAIGLNGVTVEGGWANVAVQLEVPQASMVENQKWPWTPWYVGSLKKQLEKDLRRVAQTIANLELVSRTLEARAAAKAASKPALPAAVVGQQSQGERPTLGQ